MGTRTGTVSDVFCLGLAQLDPRVGDISANRDGLLRGRMEAGALGAELVLGGELGLVGYPPEDLLLRSGFLEASASAAREIAVACDDGGSGLLFGAPLCEGDKLYNVLYLAHGGELTVAHKKCILPNYGVFDEKRYFTSASVEDISPLLWRDYRLGVLICEDCREESPSARLAEMGAQCLLVSNASPYHSGKHARRVELMAARARESGLSGVYVNLVGAQEDLVFDGTSFAIDGAGVETARLESFVEQVSLISFVDENGRLVAQPATRAAARAGVLAEEMTDDAARYATLTLGLRGYFVKSGFGRALLGLSGGIDSALTLALAVDALGADNVRAFQMPSEYTSAESREDSRSVADALGVRLEEMEISAVRAAAEATLSSVWSGRFDHREPGLAEENLQSRIRGLLLMTLSNQDGDLLLATGNKSEYAVGYATLYGDTCGGYAPLKDLYKTQVYQLARWRNRSCPKGGKGVGGVIFSERILSKAPSAELRPEQTDQDSLPSYDTLDGVLHGLLEENRTPQALVRDGYDSDVVSFVVGRLRGSEFKRRQAPPGPRVSCRAFGRDRRHPILDGFSENGIR
ncbi:MAG: NAD+ synthase [Alphaproteobacteria bacterium]